MTISSSISKKSTSLPNGWWGLATLLLLAMLLLGFAAADRSTKPSVTIVIDAGHGGKDPGKEASSSRVKHEKDLSLAIALMVGKQIEGGLKGVKLIYTRTTDKFVSLTDRVALANKSKADLFLSVHCNSNPNRHIAGTRSHFHLHNSREARSLAQGIEQQYQKAGRQSRGVQSTHDRGYSLYVLEHTNMPAVLTEVGFLTNPTEEKFLNGQQGQAILAQAIYQAVAEYLLKEHQIKPKNQQTYYQIQILASSTPLKLTDSQFDKLEDQEITEVVSEAGSFRYKYLVGKYTSKQTADAAAKFYQNKGYEGAFVKKVEPDS